MSAQCLPLCDAKSYQDRLHATWAEMRGEDEDICESASGGKQRKTNMKHSLLYGIPRRGEFFERVCEKFFTELA